MLPTTAAIEFYPSDEEELPFTEYGIQVTFEDNTLTWFTAGDHGHIRDVVSHRENGLHTEFVLADDAGVVRVRDLDPYDGVALAAAGVAQPIEVLKAELENDGGIVAQELTAVVAADNTVVTLLLETGLGLYVRYSGDWQRLTEDSMSLEDTWLLEVSPEAVDIFDASDMANSTLSAFDLPRVQVVEGVEYQIDPESPEKPTATGEDGLIVASGTRIHSIRSEDDLDHAILFARHNTGARWYVKKRAEALGAADRIPTDWR